MANYDNDMQYHLSKINMILNTLSMKPMTMFLMQQKELFDEIKQLVYRLFYLASFKSDDVKLLIFGRGI